ncbi:hypothetical protein D3C86_1628200 [compost metagenome]
MLLAIQAEHRAMLEILQGQRSQFEVFFPLQQRLGLLALGRRDERHRRLIRQADTLGTGIGRHPEFDFRTGRCVAPMPGQDEALL